MSIKNGRDYIYLIWKDNETRRQYIVGQLSKNGQFEFSYGFEVKEAIEKGFNLLISFEDINNVYKSDMLFPVFSSRLPDKKRKGIDKILSKYELDEYNEYNLLKRSGARLPIDNLEFIDPILDEDSNNIIRKFYLAGPRHYVGCEGQDCAKSLDVKMNENLNLVLEPENNQDINAIKVFNSDRIHIGYVPRYFSAGITELLRKGYPYICKVIEAQKDKNCNECIRVELEIKGKITKTN